MGLGPAGVSLACVAAEAGFTVVAFDGDFSLVDRLSRGDAAGVTSEALRSASETGRLSFSSDVGALVSAEVFVICVRGVVRDDAPVLDELIDACRSVASALGQGRLVVAESAPFLGATEELLKPLLEDAGCTSGRDFLLACSPAMTGSVDPPVGFRRSKVVGGVTPEATGVATLFYTQLMDEVVAVSSSRAAELTKLLEGAFHHVNTALVNEMALVCHESGIDVWEVLRTASLSSLGFTPFDQLPPLRGYRSPPGLAGSQLSIEHNGLRPLRLLEQALEINAEMPNYVASRIADALNDARKPVKGAHILVLGIAPDAEVADVREAPAARVMANLVRRGAVISFHDPTVASIMIEGVRFTRTELTEKAIQAADCVAVLTPGSAYDLGWVEEHARLVFDAGNALGTDRGRRVISL